MTILTIRAGDEEWEHWLALDLTVSLDRIDHQLDLTSTDPKREGASRWNLRGGAPLTMLLDDVAAFEGFTRHYHAEKGGDHRVDITAFSRARDLVNGHHEGPIFWRNVPGAQVIADVIDPYGFAWRLDAPVLPVPDEGFRVAVNDHPFDIIRRVAECNGLLIWTDMDGVIRIGKGIDEDTPVQPLGPCDYTLATETADLETRWSKVIVKWQRNNFDDDDETAQTGEEVWIDETAPRYLPLVVIESGPDAARRKIGEYITRRSIGQTQTVGLVVHSLSRPDGLRWGLGQRVVLTDDVLGINDALIVYEISARIDESGGLQLRLGLRAPQTYSGAVTAQDVRRSGEVFTPVNASLAAFDLIGP